MIYVCSWASGEHDRLAEGTLPNYRATGAKERAEESRNAFVAATRSKRLLYLSYPKTRVMPWGGTRRQAPSEFLAGAPQALHGVT